MSIWSKYSELQEAGEYKSAILLLEAYATKNNCLQAMFLLGQELGVYSYPSITDYSRSAYWFKKASDNGHNASRYEFGLALISGIGVDVNINEGKKLILSSADSGNKLALEVVLGKIILSKKLNFILTSGRS